MHLTLSPETAARDSYKTTQSASDPAPAVQTLSVTPFGNNAPMTSTAPCASPTDTPAPADTPAAAAVGSPTGTASGLRSVPQSDAVGAQSTARSVTSVADFSDCVRRIVGLAKTQGLTPPVFRSPPRLPGLDRSIQRRANGSVMIAIRRGDRPFAAVQGDVIEGVVVANSLVGEQAEQFRRAAWSALEFPTSAAVRVIPAQAVRPVPLPQRRLPSQRSRRRLVPEELNERVA